MTLLLSAGLTFNQQLLHFSFQPQAVFFSNPRAILIPVASSRCCCCCCYFCSSTKKQACLHSRVPSSGTSISAPSSFFLTSLSTSESPCLSLPSFIHIDILYTAVKVDSSLNHWVKKERKRQHTMKTASQQLGYMYSNPSCSSEKGKKKKSGVLRVNECVCVSVEGIRKGRVRK